MSHADTQEIQTKERSGDDFVARGHPRSGPKTTFYYKKKVLSKKDCIEL
jgi:hypothetical protein